MSEIKRRHGFYVPPDPKFTSAGENHNEHEYVGDGKNVPAPGTTKPDGSPLYAKDGLTQAWSGVLTSAERSEHEKAAVRLRQLERKPEVGQ
jgi:hypothetical protein